jgi:hypothetical protein
LQREGKGKGERAKEVSVGRKTGDPQMNAYFLLLLSKDSFSPKQVSLKWNRKL